MSQSIGRFAWAGLAASKGFSALCLPNLRKIDIAQKPPQTPARYLDDFGQGPHQ